MTKKNRDALRDALQVKAKARQAARLAEIRDALLMLGYDSATKQGIALGVNRKTAWNLLNRDRGAGPSAAVIKRILSSPNLPPFVRRKVQRYVDEKIAGLYGHSNCRTRAFRDQFRNRNSEKSDGVRIAPPDGMN